jgi:hypothetical protein
MHYDLNSDLRHTSYLHPYFHAYPHQLYPHKRSKLGFSLHVPHKKHLTEGGKQNRYYFYTYRPFNFTEV